MYSFIEFAKLFRTGDLCKTIDNEIMYAGRKDSLVKYQETYINLIDIEEDLCSLPFVEKSIVIYYKSAMDVENLLGFVKLLPQSPITTKKKLKHHIQERIPSEFNVEIIIIQSFPMLTNGKTDRFSLLQCYDQVDQSKRQSSVGFDITNMSAEIGVLYKDLSIIIMNVLKKTENLNLNMEANFFELGTTESDAVSTLIQLRQKGYIVSLLEFLTAKNLGEVLKIMISNDPTYHIEDDYISTFSHLNMVIVHLKSASKADMIRLVGIFLYCV